MEREFKNTDFFIEDIDESVKDLAVNDTSVTHVPANTDFFIENIDNNVMEIAVDRGLTPDVVEVVPANTDFFIVNIDSNVIKIATNLGITPTRVTKVPANTDFFIENIYYNLILICEELNIEPFEITRSPINTDFFIEAIAKNVDKIMEAQTEKHVNGSFINITLSGDSEITDYELDGNATQNGTPTPDAPVPINTVTGEQVVSVVGKNLCNNITISGTTLILYHFDKYSVQAGTYTLSTVLSDDVSSNTVALVLDGNSAGTLAYITGTAGSTVSCTFNLTEEQITQIRQATTCAIRIYKSGASFTLPTQGQLETGSQATSYEAFTSQSQEVNLGKNLVPFTNQDFTLKNVRYYAQDGSLYIDGTSTGETSSADAQFKSNFAFTLSAGTYTASHKTGLTGITAYIKKQSDNSNLATLGANVASAGFTLTEPTAVYLGFYVYQATNSNVNAEIQLEAGSQATPYASYITPIELAKIGTYQDRIYKDGEKWYIEKQVGKVEVAISFMVDALGLKGGVFAPANKKSGTSGALCDKATFIVSPTSSTVFDGSFYENPANFIFLGSTNDDLASLRTKFNGATLYYTLATPTTTEITDETLLEQLEAVYDFELKEGIVNIVLTATSPNLPAILKATIKAIE